MNHVHLDWSMGICPGWMFVPRKPHCSMGPWVLFNLLLFECWYTSNVLCNLLACLLKSCCRQNIINKEVRPQACCYIQQIQLYAHSRRVGIHWSLCFCCHQEASSVLLQWMLVLIKKLLSAQPIAFQEHWILPGLFIHIFCMVKKEEDSYLMN